MIQIDMEMPRKCSQCIFENSNYMGTNYACKITGRRTTGIREAIRDERCPLNEIDEAEKDELEVGDVIFQDGDFGIVTWIGGNIMVMWDDGSSGYYGPGDVEKTGKHFDEIKRIMEKLKEMSDEL